MPLPARGWLDCQVYVFSNDGTPSQHKCSVLSAASLHGRLAIASLAAWTPRQVLMARPAHVGHLVLDDLLDAQQLLRLQWRVEALDLEPVQLVVI